MRTREVVSVVDFSLLALVLICSPSVCRCLVTISCRLDTHCFDSLCGKQRSASRSDSDVSWTITALGVGSSNFTVLTFTANRIFEYIFDSFDRCKFLKPCSRYNYPTDILRSVFKSITQSVSQFCLMIDSSKKMWSEIVL